MVDRSVLTHVLFTGVSTGHLASLVEELARPWVVEVEGRWHHVRGGARKRAPGAGAHAFAVGEVAVVRQVQIPGYPGIRGRVADRPVLVGGVIASDPRFPAAVGPHEKPGEVLCHALSWEGISGSPVLCMVPRPATWGDLEDGGPTVRVVLAGVNAGHIQVRDDATAGALSRFVRSDVLADLLREAGVDIFELPVD